MKITASTLSTGSSARLYLAAAALALALLAIPHTGHAQGIVRGAQEGTDGARIATTLRRLASEAGLSLLATHRARVTAALPLRFSLAVHPPRNLSVSLNSFGIWMLLVVGLTVANYGYPLAQFLFLDRTGVPAYPVEAR